MSNLSLTTVVRTYMRGSAMKCAEFFYLHWRELNWVLSIQISNPLAVSIFVTSNSSLTANATVELLTVKSIVNLSLLSFGVEVKSSQ